MLAEFRTDSLVRLTGIALLVGGCVVVLRPFLTAGLLAAVLCTATWPMVTWLRRGLRGSPTAAALTMTAGLILIVLLPVVWVGSLVVDLVPTLIDYGQRWMAEGLPDPPAWLLGLPWIGPQLAAGWPDLAASRQEALEVLQPLFEPLQSAALSAGLLLAEGVAQLGLAVFIGFFFYRDGDRLADALRTLLSRVAGRFGEELMHVIDGTIKSVIYGIIGTAAAQAAIAAIGFLIVGAPAPALLALATFILSPTPIGPPAVWGSTAVWLFSQGRVGAAIFLAIWGLVGVSGIDNIVKPMIISRGAGLPFVLVLLGVLGGVLAFGFIGIFLGPTLLAVGLAVARHWADLPTDAPA